MKWKQLQDAGRPRPLMVKVCPPPANVSSPVSFNFHGRTQDDGSVLDVELLASGALSFSMALERPFKAT